MSTPTVLITGAGGYIGSQLARRLHGECRVIGVDLRPDDSAPFSFHALDVRDPALHDLLQTEGVTHVVHLAAVLEDSGDRARDFDIDVNGTRNVLTGCVTAGVAHITITSSGAAYGYHADNPAWLKETDALRGNTEFAYSDHKRQVEELLAEYRQSHPGLQQLILRGGALCWARTTQKPHHGIIPRKPRLIAVRGSDSPFVAIWDQDLLAIIEKGVRESRAGIFNVAGTGALSMREIAELLSKPLLQLPAGGLWLALAIGRALRLTRYGPAQLKFLRYRPVLDNTRLREEFGYEPQKTTREVFCVFFAMRPRARGAL